MLGVDPPSPPPLLGELGCPNTPSDYWDENNQQNDHHDLFPEVFSAYAPSSGPGGFEHFELPCRIDLRRPEELVTCVKDLHGPVPDIG
jgi:hypothetical protein